MAEINKRSKLGDAALGEVLSSLLTDVTNVRAALNVAVGKLNTLTAKLNADSGVTDTNYATDFAADTALTTTAA